MMDQGPLCARCTTAHIAMHAAVHGTFAEVKKEHAEFSLSFNTPSLNFPLPQNETKSKRNKK